MQAEGEGPSTLLFTVGKGCEIIFMDAHAEEMMWCKNGARGSQLELKRFAVLVGARDRGSRYTQTKWGLIS